MTEYLKHVYSGRIYQIMRDHGPDNPYLWSPWEFAIRYPGPVRWERFFKPCVKPDTMPTHYDIRITEEIAWEDRRLLGTKPIEVKAPVKAKRPQAREVHPDKPKPVEKPAPSGGAYTIQDLALELGCTPGQARAILRKSKTAKPQGGWKWSSSEEAEPIRKIIRKSLK